MNHKKRKLWLTRNVNAVTAVHVNTNLTVKEQTMKTTMPKLRKMIQKVISESGYGYGGHEGGMMASGQSGRGSDMPLPEPKDSRIVNWHDFKDAVMMGDIDEASDFLSDIGCEDPQDQEAFLGDAMELSADELAKEWSYRLEQM